MEQSHWSLRLWLGLATNMKEIKASQGEKHFDRFPIPEPRIFLLTICTPAKGGAEALIKHLVFRDYLTSHPERARWLAAKKIAVDNAAPTRDAYIEAKGDCYALISAESLLWANQTLGKTR